MRKKLKRLKRAASPIVEEVRKPQIASVVRKVNDDKENGEFFEPRCVLAMSLKERQIAYDNESSLEERHIVRN